MPTRGASRVSGWGITPLHTFKNFSDEILNSMFQPPNEKESHGGHRGQTPTLVPSIDISRLFVLPQGQKIKERGWKKRSAPDINL